MEWLTRTDSLANVQVTQEPTCVYTLFQIWMLQFHILNILKCLLFKMIRNVNVLIIHVLFVLFSIKMELGDLHIFKIEVGGFNSVCKIHQGPFHF